MYKEIDPKAFLAELKAIDEAVKRLKEQAAKITSPKDLRKDQTVLLLLKSGDLVTEKVFAVFTRALVVYPSSRRTDNWIDMDDIVSVEVLNNYLN